MLDGIPSRPVNKEKYHDHETQIATSRFATPVSTAVLALGTIATWRDQAERLLAYAEPISRAGLYASLAIIYAWFGAMKFTDYEAQGWCRSWRTARC